MKTLFLSLALSLFAISLSAQDFEVPKKFKPKNKKEYAEYEPAVIQAIDWLQETPLSEQAAKRKDVNAFVMLWLSGSPEVSISLKPDIITFMECADCLMVFMGGWAKYSLENKDKDELKGSLAGVEKVIEFYTNNKAHIGKNKGVEKFIKLKEKGKLENYIKSNI